MQQFYPDIIYKYPPQVKHVLFSDADIIKWGEMNAAAFKSLLPVDIVEIYFRDGGDNKLFYSSMESGDHRNNNLSAEIASIVISSKDIFRFPYYNRDKYPNLKYSDILLLGRSLIGLPVWYNNQCIGAVIISSLVPDVFRDDIIPLLASHAHQSSVIYKTLFVNTALLKDSIKAHTYLNEIPDPIFVCNAGAELEYYNAAFGRLINEVYEKGPVTVGQSLEHIVGNDFTEFRENIILAFRFGTRTFEKKYLVGGKEIWYSIELYKDKGNVICWCRKMNSSTGIELYKTVVQPALYASLPFAILLLNEKTEIVFANDYLLQILGYSKEEIANKSAFEFFSETDYALYFSVIHKIFSSDNYAKGKPYTFSFKTKGKEHAVFSGEVRKVKYEGDDCILFYGSDTLVKKERLTEEIGIDAVAFTRKLPVGIAILNDLFNCKYANKSLLKLTEYASEEISYFNFFQALFDTNQSQKIIDGITTLQKGGTYHDDVLLRSRNEKEIYVSITVIAEEDEDTNRYYIVTLEDVTAYEKQKQELIKTAENAIDTQQAGEQFLARTGHEIRTAMNGIIGLTNVLMESGLHGEQQQFLNLIKHSTDNLLVIINDILDLSKIKSGKLQFENIPVQLNTLFENLYSITLPKIGSKEINYRYEYDRDIPELVETDPVRLNQVLLNLLSNAIKFTDRGRVEYSAKLLSKNDGYATILFEITDSGIGIDEENIKSIFESYKQADKSTTRKYGGTGLGLPIVKQLVDLMGGNVYVKSTLGKGSTFSFELKLKIAKVERVQEEEVVVQANEIPEGVKVLVVDDNYINRLLVIHLLQSKGFDVVEAVSGYEALDILREDDIDVVLMDISMPDLDGFETTRIIRKSEAAYIRNVPVIAMTAHGFQEQIQDARDAGMNDYIVKPFKPEQLYKIILKQLSEEEARHPGKANEEVLYDLAFLQDYYDHEESLVNNILSLYVKDTPGSVLQMEEFVKNADWVNLKAAAHKIKTNMMMMGIRHVDEFFKVSSALNPSEPNPEKVREEFPRFRDVVLRAIKQIERDRKLG